MRYSQAKVYLYFINFIKVIGAILSEVYFSSSHTLLYVRPCMHVLHMACRLTFTVCLVVSNIHNCHRMQSDSEIHRFNS